MKMQALYILAIVLGSSLLLSACSPSLSPLYRDYEAGGTTDTLEERIVTALHEAGWDTVETSVPNVVATEEKVLSNWGLYKVTATLEVTPLGRDHVRIFIHPYRKYIVGGQGKIPYLTRRIRVRFLPELSDAFETQGFAMAGTPFERDDSELR